MDEPVTPPPTIATSTTVTGSAGPAAIHGRTDGHAPRRAPLAGGAGRGPAVNQATRPSVPGPAHPRQGHLQAKVSAWPSGAIVSVVVHGISDGRFENVRVRADAFSLR